MNHEPVTLGKTARVVRLLSLIMFRMGIDHEITYWFWKILVFPNRPLFPPGGVPAVCDNAPPRPSRGSGERAVYVVERD